MPSRILTGVLVSALIGVAALGWLWKGAMEKAQEAKAQQQVLADKLREVAERSRRREERAARMRETLDERAERRGELEEELAQRKRKLDEIEENAGEDDADEDLRCAVRDVPESVDRLLRDDED